MKRAFKLLVFAASIMTAAIPQVTLAQSAATPDMSKMAPMAPMTPMAKAPAGDLVEGEVRKVDKDARKITLKHGDIPNLEMPAMTMVFQVKDPAMLDMVKAGDKVKFKAAKTGGAITIVELQPMK